VRGTLRRNKIDPILLKRAREMRKEGAPAEIILWTFLRDRQLQGYKFRRQFSADSYILDFYCPAAKLAIELDGDSHSKRIDYDAARTKRLNELGMEIVRYDNTDIFENLDSVLNSILDHCIERCPSP
jgi:very-short-patch-repair endonuclease